MWFWSAPYIMFIIAVIPGAGQPPTPATHQLAAFQEFSSETSCLTAAAQLAKETEHYEGVCVKK